MYRKTKPPGSARFTEYLGCRLHRWQEIFSRHEAESIVATVTALGAGFAELDVLRDRATGLPYVVDVNVTPFGPISLDTAGGQATGRLHSFAIGRRRRRRPGRTADTGSSGAGSRNAGTSEGVGGRAGVERRRQAIDDN